MNKEEILEEAKRIVTTDRQNDYGEAEDNFAKIAILWSAYLDMLHYEADKHMLGPEDVAIMMIFLKVARIKSGHHKDDNWTDIAGYAACGGELGCMR